MQPQLNTLIYAASLALVAHAIPVSKRDTTASPQDNTVSVENEVTVLAGEFINEEGPYAREVLTSAQYFMSLLGPQVLQPSSYLCPVSNVYVPITTLSEAINNLNATQTYLGELLVDILTPSEGLYTTNDAFCNANNTLTRLGDYTYNVVGASNQSVTAGNGESYTQIALQALQASLDVIPQGEPSTTLSQIAYNHTTDAIATFTTASGYSSIIDCPILQLPPANSSADAAGYATKLLQEIVPQTYEDVAAGDAAVGDFCTIGSYMIVIEDYVMAYGS